MVQNKRLMILSTDKDGSNGNNYILIREFQLVYLLSLTVSTKVVCTHVVRPSSSFKSIFPMKNGCICILRGK